MIISTNRHEETKETNYLVVYIGESFYRITETIDGKLSILKNNDNTMEMQIYPRSANVIDIN